MNIGESSDVQRVLTLLLVEAELIVVDRDTRQALVRLADRSRKTLGAGMGGNQVRAALTANSQARQL